MDKIVDGEVVAMTQEEVAEWEARAAAVILPTLEDYDRALTEHLDAAARVKRYDNRINCALRAGYPGPFQAEGIAFATWMDTCNAIGYQMLLDFQTGTIPQPTIQEMLDTLPVMVWPGP